MFTELMPVLQDRPLTITVAAVEISGQAATHNPPARSWLSGVSVSSVTCRPSFRE